MQRFCDNRLSVVKGYTINHRDTNAGTIPPTTYVCLCVWNTTSTTYTRPDLLVYLQCTY